MELPTDVHIGPLAEGERARHAELLDRGFVMTLKRILGFVPPVRAEGTTRLAARFDRPETLIYAARDEKGEVQGVIHLQKTGSRSVIGPMAVSPQFQAPSKRGVATALAATMVREAGSRGCPAIDSMTFPQSIVHYNLYSRFGIPVFVTPFLGKRPGTGRPPPADRGVSVQSLAELNEAARAEAIEGAYEVTHAIYPGLDHRVDLRHAHEQDMGTVLIARRADRVVGFAICHHRARGEQFMNEQLLIKYLYVSPTDSAPVGVLGALLGAIEEVALSEKLRDIAAMGSTGRRVILDVMLGLGFRVRELHSQFLFVSGADPARTQEVAAASFRADHLALAEWR